MQEAVKSHQKKRKNWAKGIKKIIPEIISLNSKLNEIEEYKIVNNF